MISPIENNGMIARTQDYSSFKQLEDIKTSGEQVQLQQQTDEKGDEKVKTVHHSDNSDGPDTHHDAREEGRNKYFGSSDGRRKSKPESDGIVRIKGQGGFDFKI